MQQTRTRLCIDFSKLHSARGKRGYFIIRSVCLFMYVRVCVCECVGMQINKRTRTRRRPVANILSIQPCGLCLYLDGYETTTLCTHHCAYTAQFCTIRNVASDTTHTRTNPSARTRCICTRITNEKKTRTHTYTAKKEIQCECTHRIGCRLCVIESNRDHRKVHA